MSTDISPSRRHLLVGAGLGATALAVGAVPVLNGVAHAQENSNLSGEDLALTLFHRSMELAFVAIYDEAIDTGLLDDEQTAQALSFRTHHNEHAASATALAGVAVGPNQALISDFTRQVRAVSTVDALFDVLFELESQGDRDVPAGVWHLRASSGGQPGGSDPVRGSAACDGHRAGRQPAGRRVGPSVRVGGGCVHPRRVPGPGALMATEFRMYRDELRRQLREAEQAQRESMGPWRDAVMRFASGDGSIDRRRLFVLGGGGLLAAAVLAACGGEDPEPQIPQGGDAVATTVTVEPPPVDDVTLLRTSSSLEHLAVDAYQSVLDMGLLTTPPLIDAAELFQQQHREHAALFEAATTEAGGQPFTEANPNLQVGFVEPSLETLTDEISAVNFALELEDTAGATYQVFVPLFSTRELRQTVQSVGGVERRHSVILTAVIPDEQLIPSPFGIVTLAVGPASYIPPDE